MNKHFKLYAVIRTLSDGRKVVITRTGLVTNPVLTRDVAMQIVIAVW